MERGLRQAALAASAFSFWEVALLHAKGRILNWSGHLRREDARA